MKNKRELKRLFGKVVLLNTGSQEFPLIEPRTSLLVVGALVEYIFAEGSLNILLNGLFILNSCATSPYAFRIS